MLDPHSDSPSAATKRSILVIDDEADIRESLEVLLTMEGYEVELAVNAADGLSRMERGSYDLVLLDLMMPDRSGIEVLDEVRQRDHETPIFLITAYGSTQVAVNALKGGANDYFSKPWDNEKLLLEIGRMIGANRLERENVQLKRALKQRYGFENIIGKSERMMKVLDLVSQVAPSRSTVMITGETGTGKELIAKAIHSHSPRAGQVFIPVNTGALTPELLESTLFGHVKGAFTSAIASRKGYFEEANRGTMFFDEISTISPDTQVKLLRVIQERQFMPLGSSEIINVDVRLIAATNRDMIQLVKDGKFREDLYYRLNVYPISVPPLRERMSDVPELVNHFLARFAAEEGKRITGLTDGALRLLASYAWPGNVRELENAVERAVVLSSGTKVSVDVLPEHILEAGGLRIRRDAAGALPPDASLFEVVADYERRKIIEALEACHYSQTEAAERLRIPLSTLNQKIKRLDIAIRKRGDK